MALVSCPECGKKVSDQSDSCIGCGYPLNPLSFNSKPANRINPKHQQGKKSKGAAAFLALFLGGLGVHKFYLEQPIMGLIYLCFCWTFVPAILGALEGLNYIFMSQKTFAERHG
jgi:TM2 domain-containing membrane protein YozV